MNNLAQQSVDPTSAVEVITGSGVLGALVIVMLFVSRYLLKLLLKAKDERIDDKTEALTKQYEIQTATKEVLNRVLEELRVKR